MDLVCHWYVSLIFTGAMHYYHFHIKQSNTHLPLANAMKCSHHTKPLCQLPNTQKKRTRHTIPIIFYLVLYFLNCHICSFNFLPIFSSSSLSSSHPCFTKHNINFFGWKTKNKKSLTNVLSFINLYLFIFVFVTSFSFYSLYSLTETSTCCFCCCLHI